LEIKERVFIYKNLNKEEFMKRIIFIIICSSFLFVSLPVVHSKEIYGLTKAPGKEDSPVQLFGMIKEVNGEVWTILDSKGQEWEIRVDETTEKKGYVALPGFVVNAQIEADGHAKEIKVVGNS
jgi:hypothetical protein